MPLRVHQPAVAKGHLTMRGTQLGALPAWFARHDADSASSLRISIPHACRPLLNTTEHVPTPRHRVLAGRRRPYLLLVALHAIRQVIPFRTALDIAGIDNPKFKN